jgi:hypothetical protein
MPSESEVSPSTPDLVADVQRLDAALDPAMPAKAAAASDDRPCCPLWGEVSVRDG